jgi:hypothetical protein
LAVASIGLILFAIGVLFITDLTSLIVSRCRDMMAQRKSQCEPWTSN